ncbi:MAG: D-glycero-beta-D-manno-heptose-7-phosphate kinase [Marinifilaceae bacterium]
MNTDFSHCNVLIIGDVMLDKYYIGKVDRISPEAPVPVVNITKEESRLGGASNVAHNVVALGGKATLMGVVGYDFMGKEIERMAKQHGIGTSLLKGTAPTITKARVIGGKQQIVRIDYEERISLSELEQEHFINNVNNLIHDAGIVVLSDYGKGVITNELAQRIIQIAQAVNKPILVDPKGKEWTKYKGATIVTPNVKELSDVVGRDVANEDAAIETAAAEVLKMVGLDALLVTRSEKGMSYISATEILHIPTYAQEVFDVSGAGDTVVATLACGLNKGLSIKDAIHVANVAAGIVVRKIGTATLSANELEREL